MKIHLQKDKLRMKLCHQKGSQQMNGFFERPRWVNPGVSRSCKGSCLAKPKDADLVMEALDPSIPLWVSEGKETGRRLGSLGLLLLGIPFSSNNAGAMKEKGATAGQLAVWSSILKIGSELWMEERHITPRCCSHGWCKTLHALFALHREAVRPPTLLFKTGPIVKLSHWGQFEQLHSILWVWILGGNWKHIFTPYLQKPLKWSQLFLGGVQLPFSVLQRA